LSVNAHVRVWATFSRRGEAAQAITAKVRGVSWPLMRPKLPRALEATMRPIRGFLIAFEASAHMLKVSGARVLNCRVCALSRALHPCTRLR